ncbi:NAD(P)/FAD-dependent oxidoreductase [Clostridium sp. P21]|uniref:NAD(P)/FAD-dependent oxidoreductase n=1 Tax=Clostridium muellerianum TaxID=2716538 RepID=A0A7Y0HMH5_9CLOT|nr:NAD(P)/FAD-dependent oxidoreductase [Clostridium muellerianum]NMM62190.1 NAD(P)/FAD-dependent oxidoreductase [Clostridium muellerianum]
MSIKISNLNISIDESIDDLKDKVCKKLRVSSQSIESFKILRESIDARRKDNIKFNYVVEVKCDKESKIVNKVNDKDVKVQEEVYTEEFIFGSKKMSHRPVIVGMGPAGMFAGLLLAEKGYRPIIIERGEKVEDRTNSINKFWSTGKLNLQSNVQFGEGGAGTFSDGKLTTRIKDARCDFVLDKFVKAGAPEEILYNGKPHIGTDILKEVVKNIREKIIELGGEVRFNSKLEDVIVSDGAVKSVIVNGDEIPSESLVLAIGHSSRDTYEMLYRKGIFMEAKAFAIGVRVEHSQQMMNENQYGKYANHPKLKAADYRLTYNTRTTGRGVYSFCMCPGGEVVAAASEEERLVTNGMSFFKRDKENANSAMVVSVNESDFQGDTPLKGMEFQRHYERLAYILGGGGYIAPVQLIGDFLKDEVSTKLGNIKPTYKPGYEFKDLRKCLPHYVTESLKEGFINFDKKIKGFASGDGVLTGIETRTSAPVRILRNEKLQSVSAEGLYPCGEGAGFAGGIMSAAVDGIKVAENIIKEYSPLD